MTKAVSNSHLEHIFHFDGRVVAKSISEIQNHGPSGPFFAASIGVRLALADASSDNVAWLPVSHWFNGQEPAKSELYDSIRVGDMVFGIMEGAVRHHAINYRNGVAADGPAFST